MSLRVTENMTWEGFVNKANGVFGRDFVTEQIKSFKTSSDTAHVRFRVILNALLQNPGQLSQSSLQGIADAMNQNWAQRNIQVLPVQQEPVQQEPVKQASSCNKVLVVALSVAAVATAFLVQQLVK